MKNKDIKIARLSVSELKGNISVIDMHYLIAERNRKVKHYVDRHELGLFENRKTLQYMRETGLKAKYLKNGLMRERAIYWNQTIKTGGKPI